MGDGIPLTCTDHGHGAWCRPGPISAFGNDQARAYLARHEGPSPDSGDEAKGVRLLQQDPGELVETTANRRRHGRVHHGMALCAVGGTYRRLPRAEAGILDVQDRVDCLPVQGRG